MLKYWVFLINCIGCRLHCLSAPQQAKTTTFIHVQIFSSSAAPTLFIWLATSLGFRPGGSGPKTRSDAPEAPDAFRRRAGGEGQRYARQASSRNRERMEGTESELWL